MTTSAFPDSNSGRSADGPRAPTGSRDPSVGFGTIMGSVWLVFLAFPLIGVLEEADGPRRWVGLTIVAVFGIVYFAGFAASNAHTFPRADVDRWSVATLVVLVALSLALGQIIGLGALGMGTFIVAIALYSLPRAWGFMIAALGVAVTAIVPYLDGSFAEHAFFPLITGVTAVSNMVVLLFLPRWLAYDEAQGELRRLTDRERLARDVHDLLGHSLTALALKAQLAERLVDADPERAKAELREIQQLSRESIAEVRRTVVDLREAELAVQVDAVRRVLADAGVATEVSGDPRDADPEVSRLLGWVLREAVTNVVRHSRAQRCAIGLGERRVSVSDDGVGVRGALEGNGLRGIRERVDEVGGSLSVSTGESGRGTTVEVVL